MFGQPLAVVVSPPILRPYDCTFVFTYLCLCGLFSCWPLRSLTDCGSMPFYLLYISVVGSQVVSLLGSGTEGPGFKSQP